MTTIEHKRKLGRDSYKRVKERRKNDIRYRLNWLLQQARVRAKKKNLESDIDIDFLMSIYPADGKCPILGIELQFNTGNYAGSRWNSPSLDRIDNTKGYTKDNVHIISSRANIIKRDATLEELEAIVLYLKDNE
jgi:hypothetical protein